jgi:glutathione synthase/RimK-type ligase-like ATP-grasp enzyme
VIGLVTYAKYPSLTDDDRPLIAELERVGIEARPVDWDADDDWSRFEALVLRSCWDYHLRPDDFARWLDRLDRAGVPLWNPSSVVRWNMHKAYLRDLERAGIAIPRTVWLQRGQRASLADVMTAEQWDEAVVKPAVSASATHTWRVSADATSAVPFDELIATSDVLVQELIPEVADDGEWSIMMIDGTVSHAAIKRPRPGDFRVQWEHGGTAERAQLPDGVRRAAEDVARLIPGRWLYARVDGVVTPRGFVLMELECIEPHLFFDFHPESRTRFAAALARLSV